MEAGREEQESEKELMTVEAKWQCFELRGAQSTLLVLKVEESTLDPRLELV